MNPPTPGTYCGYRDETGGSPVMTPDGHALPLKPSLKLWSPSPTGFRWGYAGSGPAQLALALLLHHSIDEKLKVTYGTVSARCTRDLGFSSVPEFIEHVRSGQIIQIMKDKYSDKRELIDRELGDLYI